VQDKKDKDGKDVKTAKITNVTTGTVDGLTTAVTGIEPGDVIADSSFEKLQDGSPVHVSTQPIPGTGSAAERNAP
jgi:multidrug efflux system membrane fusion protein